jgi:hypothetical protein
MRSMKRCLDVCLVLVAGFALAAGSFPAAAEEEKSDGASLRPNVRLTIEIGRLEKGAKSSVSSYEILTAANGEPMVINTGSRIPIPTTNASTVQAAEGKPAMTGYSFQNVGMNARLRTTLDEKGWIRVMGNIEASSPVGDRASADPTYPPVITQLQQEINVRLRDGRASRVVAINEPGRNSAYIEIKADLID